jgi:replicative DNA helicase
MLLAKHETSLSTPFYLPLELKAMDPAWLAERMQEAKLKHDCCIFMIDHLHFLVDMQTQQNLSLNIGAFMRQLKMIALRLKVAIILIAHQKSLAKGSEPSLEDVRDSSFIAQEADNFIVVWRQPDYSDADLRELEKSSPVQAHTIRGRKSLFPSMDDKFADQFAVIQIAKARRSGAFRVKKLFQKVGQFMEEI